MIDPDGGRFSYVYDSTGRLDSVLNPQSNRYTFGYDAANRRLWQANANGTRTSYTYDAADRMTKLENLKSDGSLISSFEYGYDNVGNPTSVLEADGDRVTWTYDNVYQLKTEVRTGTGAYRLTHTYDPVGNRTAQADGASITTYTYDAANQLSVSFPATSTVTYAYDKAGNLEVEQSGSGRTTHTWDSENRLLRVHLSNNSINTFVYDADGLRVRKEVGSTVTKFIWDGLRYLHEADASNATQNVFTCEPSTFGKLLFQRSKSGVSWNPLTYHFDRLGSTDRTTLDDQSVHNSYVYRAFGSLQSSSGTTQIPFRFVGQQGYYHDTSRATSYVRQRHYAPGMARWLSRDRVGVNVDPCLYLYVGNRPLLLRDPSGLLAWADVCDVFAQGCSGKAIAAACCANSFLGSVANIVGAGNPLVTALSALADCLCDEIGAIQNLCQCPAGVSEGAWTGIQMGLTIVGCTLDAWFFGDAIGNWPNSELPRGPQIGFGIIQLLLMLIQESSFEMTGAGSGCIALGEFASHLMDGTLGQWMANDCP